MDFLLFQNAVSLQTLGLFLVVGWTSTLVTERRKISVNNFIFVFRSEHDILFPSHPRKMQTKMKLEPSETSLREKAKGKTHRSPAWSWWLLLSVGF